VCSRRTSSRETFEPASQERDLLHVSLPLMQQEEMHECVFVPGIEIERPLKAAPRIIVRVSRLVQNA
jgi:hypothetical protein